MSPAGLALAGPPPASKPAGSGPVLLFTKEPQAGKMPASAPVNAMIVPVQARDGGAGMPAAGGAADGGGDADANQVNVQLDPPGIEQLFKLDSEKTMEERIKQQSVQRNAPNSHREGFPDKPKLSMVSYSGRRFPSGTFQTEPAYVIYHRLYFEDINTERYGWELGILQPVVSAVEFYKDVILLPFHLGSYPLNKFSCSAGPGPCPATRCRTSSTRRT